MKRIFVRTIKYSNCNSEQVLSGEIIMKVASIFLMLLLLMSCELLGQKEEDDDSSSDDSSSDSLFTCNEAADNKCSVIDLSDDDVVIVREGSGDLTPFQ